MGELNLPRDDSYVRNFNRVAFFEKHKSKFREMPKYGKATYPTGGYPSEWWKIRNQIKDRDNWCCQCCLVNLSKIKYKRLLHAHHRNGVLGDVDDENLISLCALCHEHQPYHSKRVSKEDDKLIVYLRKEQDLPLECPICSS